MNWNLQTFLAYYLVAIASLVVIFALGRLLRKKNIPKEKPQGVKFLEAALEDDLPPNKSYTYADLQRDLRDPKLTLSDIYDKCGGALPQKPEEPEVQAEKHTQTSGVENPERLAKLQGWFNQVSKTVPLRKVVAPPLPQPPVVAFQGQTATCTSCRGSGSAYAGYGSYGATSTWPTSTVRRTLSESGKCSSCNGTGFVIITGK